VSVGRAIFDDEVSPFDVAEVFQSRTQRIQIRVIRAGRYRFEDTYSIDLFRFRAVDCSVRNEQRRGNTAGSGSWNGAGWPPGRGGADSD